MLFVHPQTVRYRMGQLREAYGDGLDDPETVLALTVALACSPPALVTLRYEYFPPRIRGGEVRVTERYKRAAARLVGRACNHPPPPDEQSGVDGGTEHRSPTLTT